MTQEAMEALRSIGRPSTDDPMSFLRTLGTPTVGQYVRQVGSSLLGGLTDVAAGTVEGLGIAERALTNAPPGYQTVQEIAGGALRRNVAIEPPANEQANQSFLAATLPSAIGSTAGFFATGGVGELAGLSAAASAAVSGALVNGAAGYYEAKYHGASEDTAWTSFLGNAAVGTSQALEVGRIFSRINKQTGGKLKRILIDGVTEGGQETMQQAASNLIAQHLYDNDRKVLQDLAENGGAGFLTGIIFGAASEVSQRGPADVADVEERVVPDVLGAVPLEEQTTGAAPVPSSPPSSGPGAAASVLAELSDANKQDVREVAAPTTPEAQYVQEFASQRGLKVRFVEGDGPLEVHGAHDRATGTMYVDRRAPLRAVAYHETVHQLGEEADALADDLRKLDPEGSAKYEAAYLARYRQEGLGDPTDLTEEGVAFRAELNAGLVYEALQRPERLRAMLESKPGAWTRIVDAIVRAFQKVGLGVRTSKQRALDALRREVAGQDASRALDSETAIRVALRIRDAFETLQPQAASASGSPSPATEPATSNLPEIPDGSIEHPRAVVVDSNLLSRSLRETKDAPAVARSYMEEDAAGVVVGQPTALDKAIQAGRVNEKELRDAFSDTREHLRKTYGETVTLYRTEPPSKNLHKDTRLVFMGDESLARKFEREDRKAVPYTVSVDDILAVYTTDSGYYEFIVKAQPRASQEVGGSPETTTQLAGSETPETSSQTPSDPEVSSTAARATSPALTANDYVQAIRANINAWYADEKTEQEFQSEGARLWDEIASKVGMTSQVERALRETPLGPMPERGKPAPKAPPRMRLVDKPIIVAEMPKGAQIGTDLTGEPVYSKVERGPVARPGAGVPQPKVTQPGIFDEVGGLYEQQAYGTEEPAPVEPPSRKELLANPAVRESLAAMASEVGTEGVGGQVIREESDQLGSGRGKVIGRTRKTAKAEWWGRRPGDTSPAYVKRVIKRALAGAKLTAQETETVDFLLHEASTAIDPATYQSGTTESQKERAAIQNESKLRNRKVKDVPFSVAPRTDSPEFKRWFGESKVVDGAGKPLVVYHGTMQEFIRFMHDKLGANTGAKNTKLGFFFSSSPSVASTFGDRVVPAYLSIKNPLVVGFEKGRYNKYDRSGEISDGYGPVKDAITKSSGRSSWEDVTAEDVSNWVTLLESNGFDGLSIYTSTDSVDIERYGYAATGRGLYRAAPHTMWVAFRPEQIKSATGNRGTFDPKNPDIRFSVAPKGSFDLPDDTRSRQFNRALLDSFEALRLTPELDSAISRRPGLAYGRAERVQAQTIRGMIDVAKKVGKEQADKFLYALHAPTRNKIIAERSGGKMGEESQPGSGMTTSDARKIAAEGLKNPDLVRLRDMNRRLNRERLDALEQAGLLSKEQRAEWEKFGPDYVPLRTADDPGSRVSGGSLNVAGPESKRAEGRSTIADSPLSFGVSSFAQAVERAERNKVGQLFADYVEQHPGDQWGVYKSKDAIPEGWEVLSLKRDGEPVYIGTSNEAIAAAFKQMDVAKATGVLKVAGVFRRYMHNVIIKYNPPFALSNAFRDMGTASAKITITDKAATGARVLKNAPAAMLGSWKALREEGKGGEWGKWYREARDAGALVGWNELGSFQDVEDAISRSKRGAILNAIEQANRGVELGTRVALYEAMRAQGKTQEQAALIARDGTTDFARRGNYSSQLSSLYLFANANLQGTASLWRAVAAHPARGTTVLGALVAMGYLASLASRQLGDDWDDIPDYQKRRMGGVMAGGTLYGVPLPYGFDVFYYLGARAEAAANGRAQEDSLGMDVLEAAIQSFSPVQGADFLQTVTPTIGRPLVEIATNKDFAGNPIRPQQSPFDRTPSPRSEQTFASVDPTLKAATQGLNRATGGDSVRPGAIDVSAEDVEHVLKFLGGGLGSNAQRLITAANKWTSGEPVRKSDIPILRTFMSEVPESAVSNLYYDNLAAIEREVEARKKGEEVLDARALALSTYARNVDGRVRKIRERMKASPELRPTLEPAMRAAMASLNERLAR